MITEKKCKGIGKAHDYNGCGLLVQANTRRYGLCPKCFFDWMTTTAQGKLHYEKQFISKARKNMEERAKEIEKAKLDKMRQNIETKSEVEKKLQKEINTIVRLIDHGHPCISSGRPLGRNFDAGHFYSVGSNPSLRFHLFNIWAQSVHDNQWKSGNPLGYVGGLKSTFGPDLLDRVMALKKLPILDLSKDEIKAATSRARGVVKWLKLQNRHFTKSERISLRERFHIELGIY